MVVCSNCGAHYSEEFLQCPQCGSTKRITEAEEKNNNSPIGFLVTLAVVLFLLGIIGYGIYFLYNPVKDDNIISDIENIDITTTTNEQQSRTTTTAVPRSTTTTTKLVGTEGTALGARYTYTRPEGFVGMVITEEVKQTYGFDENVDCFSKDSEQYCLGIRENTNISINSTNKEEVNGLLHGFGFSDLISTRLYGSTYYYYYKKDGEKIIGGLLKNKGSNMVILSFDKAGAEVNEETMSTAVGIISSLK